jgi:CHASE3 domain sensor protein
MMGPMEGIPTARRGFRSGWRPTLRLRVQAVVGLLLVLLAVAGLAVLATNRRAEQANHDLAQDVLPALVAVERLQKAYLDQETEMRGFALTSQPQFLEPFNEAPEAIEAQERVLDRTLAGDRAAEAKLAAVRQAHGAG